jgi:hypothetical protein
MQQSGRHKLTWGASQGLRGALQLSLQLPAIRGIDGRLQCVHARCQRIHVSIRICHLLANLLVET